MWKRAFFYFLYQEVVMFTQSRRLLLDCSGADYGEYAVLAVVIVLAGVAAFMAFGGRIVDIIQTVTAGI